MPMFRKSLVAIVLTLVITACQESLPPADLIIIGGKIYTMETDRPMADALAVRGDTIIYTGDSIQVMDFKGPNTQVINLKGKTLTPGFIEGHGHIMGLGYNEMNLDLMGTKNFDEIVSMVKSAAAKAAPGEWIVGRGWHQDKWDVMPSKMVKGFPTHDLLSEAAPNNPVVLSHASGHNALVNAEAMRKAGIYALNAEKINVPVGGEIIRDALGNPTGLFNETAEDLIYRVMPQNSPESDQKALELAIAACLRNGVTSFQSAGENDSVIELIKKFRDGGKLSTRMYLMLSGSDHELVNKYFQSGPSIDKWVNIRSVKLYGDGALGSRGAWLLEDYADEAGNRGQPNMVIDSVYSVSRRALKSGFQVNTHAIGDRANREVLDQYEKAFMENPGAAENSRFRIEHAQHLHPNDIPRFKKLGVIAAMQAVHLSSDRPWAINRLGVKRIIDGAYVWKSLLNTGAIIVNGSDVPVEPINPLASFYASVTRKTLKGEPEEGYEPEQAMSREQALRSYTLDAAYGAFEENIKGSIRPGKLADFTVFSKDIMSVPANEILSTKVEMTIVGGKILYQSESNN
jgi:predicted amidohydrolase YtcJ